MESASYIMVGIFGLLAVGVIGIIGWIVLRSRNNPPNPDTQPLKPIIPIGGLVPIQPLPPNGNTTPTIPINKLYPVDFFSFDSTSQNPTFLVSTVAGTPIPPSSMKTAALMMTDIELTYDPITSQALLTAIQSNPNITIISSSNGTVTFYSNAMDKALKDMGGLHVRRSGTATGYLLQTS